MTDVYLEVGRKKVFACALDWPGWARSGKTEEAALEALAEYEPRYAVIAKKARVAFKPGDFNVVEKLTGDASTEFGIPGQVAAADRDDFDATTAAKLLKAAWAVFDEVVGITPEHLTKGPRGGGRDRDKMVAHVHEAEESYAKMIGLRKPSRDEILAVIRKPPAESTKWPIRYAARRITWHVLDHLWEMQDKTPR